MIPRTRSLVGLLGALLAVAGVLVGRTLLVPAPPPPVGVGDAAPAVTIDPVAAADRLAAAVRFPTVSYASGGPIDTAAFLGLRHHLEAAYPLIHATLGREVVAGLSLLYTWPGTDPSLAPVVLMGHQDVVPVPEESRARWAHDPFAGEIADGYVWGRGTLDDKVTVLAILEAVEALLREGHRPVRTVYQAFGHDEEVGGAFGARAMVDLLVGRGVRPAMVLDEGGALADSLVPGLDGPAAIVGIAEKGYVSLRLTATAAGGHSSMPPATTAIGDLSRAIAALESNQFPARLDGPARRMLEAAAPYLSFGPRLVIANLWLTGPFVARAMGSSPIGAALLRTTTAPTMLDAGIKDNVLPPAATAVVNFRIRPGETVASVTTRVQKLVGSDRLTVTPLERIGGDPSPVSDIGSPAWRLIAETIRAMSPGKTVPVLPYVVMGGTDAKFWAPHSDRVFRFLAVPLRSGDLERIHGVNERVGVQDFAVAVDYFVRLLRGTDTLHN
jgi:carboxypeptidase PM20D1